MERTGSDKGKMGTVMPFPIGSIGSKVAITRYLIAEGRNHGTLVTGFNIAVTKAKPKGTHISKKRTNKLPHAVQAAGHKQIRA